MVTLLISPNYVCAAGNEKSSIMPASSLKVENPHYYGSFTIAKGSTKQINVSVAPSGAKKPLLWRSDNDSVVKVSGQGLLRGVKDGNAMITVNTSDGSGVKLTIPVVVGVPVSKITTTTKKLNLKEGEKSKLIMKVLPAEASNNKLVYYSSDEAIATVSQEGEITAISEGKARIYACSADGNNKKAVVEVTVTSSAISRTLTNKDVINGQIKISNVAYKNLMVDDSVGNARITLNHVTIKRNLELANGAKYTVYANESKINNVIALEEESMIQSYALETEMQTSNPAPTFVAGKGTLVVTVDARGNLTVKQEGAAQINTVTVSRAIGGNIELKLEGYNGNLVINTSSNADIAITTSACNISEATISGSYSGQTLSLVDDPSGGKSSSITKINIETSAEVKVDILAKELVIAETIEQAKITVEKPLEKIVNNGKKTELEVNSNVTNVQSSGNALNMKVSAGSTITEIASSGAESKINVALGSTITNVITSGSSSVIGGAGTIEAVKVEGDNTVINNKDVVVTVADNVQGTTANGEEVKSKDTANLSVGAAPFIPFIFMPTNSQAVTTIAPAATPAISPSDTAHPTQAAEPTQSGNPSNDPKVTEIPVTTPEPAGDSIPVRINDPGKIIAGNPVHITADTSEIHWEVYGDIDSTNGSAWIEEDTGILHPVSSGNIRIVAVSNKDRKRYGAVDATVYSKKFVKVSTLATITVNEDLGMITIADLENADLLPKKIDLTYETGNGTETEVITVDISDDWYGSYHGSNTGNIMLTNNINVPSGYERPEELEATVCVQVNQVQSNWKKNIIGVEAVGDIVLTSDEHLVEFGQLYAARYSNLTVKLKVSDGTTIACPVNGWYSRNANEYNGTVADTYKAELYVEVPNGYLYYQETTSPTTVYWSQSSTMPVPVNIVVQTNQTPESDQMNEDILPATTQPRFIINTTAAQITQTKLANVPTSIHAGQIIDFSQYLTVDTTSLQPSDHNVVWTVNGYGIYINGTNGTALLTYPGTYQITATSVIDRTKSASATITVNPRGNLTFTPVTIDVDEDLEIADFLTMYQALKDQLPKSIDSVDNQLQHHTIAVEGWYLTSYVGNTLRIEAMVTPLEGYPITTLPSVIILLNVNQTDTRIKVKEYSPVKAEYTISEDIYAVTNAELFKAIFGNYLTAKIPVKVTLTDDTEKTLECSIYSWSVQESPSGLYKGYTGDINFNIKLNYPVGYIPLQYLASPADIAIEIPVHITVAQTPKNEELWVTQQPKLTYHIGDTLDLSQLRLRVRDTVANYTTTDHYISADQFEEYGILMRWNNPYGSPVAAGSPLPYDKNHQYIYLFDTKNFTYTFFGPISIDNNRTITGFETYATSNGAVGSTYYATIGDYMATLPAWVYAKENVVVPVLSWSSDGDTSDYGQRAATYTFTAKLGTIPEGYSLAEGVKATASMTIAENLSIESIETLWDIKVLLNNNYVRSMLPEKITVTLSDGVTKNYWMPVTWNLDNFNPSAEGTYTITGTMSKPNILNNKNLTPTINIIVENPYRPFITGIEVTSYPNKRLYRIGEPLDTTGLCVLARYSDGSSTDVTANSLIYYYNNTTEGIKNLSAIYQGWYADFQVYVDNTENEDNTVVFNSASPNLFVLEVALGSAIATLPQNPERAGYDFAGWYYNGESVTADTIPTRDMVVTAAWTPIEIDDMGTQLTASGSGVHVYALYKNESLVKLSGTSASNTMIINNWLGIDLYTMESGWHTYTVSDQNGNSYSMTINNTAPAELSVTNTGSAVMLDGKAYIKYLLNFAKTTNSYFMLYYYDHYAINVFDSENQPVLYMAKDTPKGTYRFVIQYEGQYYKTAIIIN